MPQPNSATDAIGLTDTITLARVVCILGIVYVHAWTGLTGEQLAAVATSPQSLLRWVLVEAFGRSAVPLLGMISGWLVAGSTRPRRDHAGFLRSKALALLLPMLIWNALSILLVSGAGALGLIQAPVPRSLWWLVDELFCLATPNDINVQTAFLRDLFLCMAAAPVLARLRGGWLALPALVLLGWIGSGVQVPLLLRPQIMLFFIAGIALRRGTLPARLARLSPVAVLVPFVLVAGFNLWLDLAGRPWLDAWRGLFALADIPVRLCGALFFWRLAHGLAGSAMAPALKRLEPYMFLLFCCHLILIWLGGPAIGLLTGPLGAPLYPLFLVAHPALVLGATMLLGRALLAVAPRFAGVASGGRLRRRAARPPPACLHRPSHPLHPGA